jgi:hypothetical protein
MSEPQRRIVQEMKKDLLARVEEWLGFDIPEEDSDDYELWQDKLAQIRAVENAEDVLYVLESEGADVADFIACGEYSLMAAGLRPDQVPYDVVVNLGRPISAGPAVGHGGAAIFSYEGHFFVCFRRSVRFTCTSEGTARSLRSYYLNT